MDLFKKYDVVLAEHFINAKRNAKYSSHIIQNEILNLMAEEASLKIINDIKFAKYFTLILDSTQDISKKEQLSLSLRFIGKKGFPEERFLSKCQVVRQNLILIS